MQSIKWAAIGSKLAVLSPFFSVLYWLCGLGCQWVLAIDVWLHYQILMNYAFHKSDSLSSTMENENIHIG